MALPFPRSIPRNQLAQWLWENRDEVNRILAERRATHNEAYLAQRAADMRRLTA